MIFSINGFGALKEYPTKGQISGSEVNLLLQSINAVCAPKTPTGSVGGQFGYYISSGTQYATVGANAVSFFPTMTSYAAVITSVGPWVSQVGDTLTMGSRVIVPSEYLANDLRLGGFTSGSLASVLDFPMSRYSGGQRSVYVELEISKVNDTTYRMQSWVDGVQLQGNTTTTRPSQMVIGTGYNWSPGTSDKLPTTQLEVRFMDQYWAFNQEGLTERVGNCSVRTMPNELIAGQNNPNSEYTLSNRMGYNHLGGEYSPTSLVDPAASKAVLTGLDPSLKVAAVSSTLVGRSSSTGRAVDITAQIVGQDGEIVKSKTVTNSSQDYAQGVSKVTIPVASRDELSKMTFVASGEKSVDV